MSCIDKLLPLQCCATSAATWMETLHNKETLLTVKQSTDAQAEDSTAQELRCLSQGESEGFACAVFPFKHPLR